MVYPNIPGRLSRSPYTDPSSESMSIASPRADHVDVSPHTQAPYTQRLDLPSHLYSGMSSMRISSPYSDYTRLPSHASDPKAPMHHTTERKSSELVYHSNHWNTHHSHHGHGNTSNRVLQQDYKMPVEQLVMEQADRSSQRRDHTSMFNLREMPPGITGDNKDMVIKTEDAEPRYMDTIDLEFPQSSRLGLQAVLDEANARDESAERAIMEDEEELQRELAERPNDPLLIEHLRRNRSLARMLVQSKELCNDMLRQVWYTSGRDSGMHSQRCQRS
ncbi:hypothetical protein DENSPDRAFT_514545 [Dentipellis sp. KUC8613]|nr:hypothetical protein DENSPDRAFT_514545 [Dentipellis sp. KUC8613]